MASLIGWKLSDVCFHAKNFGKKNSKSLNEDEWLIFYYANLDIEIFLDKQY
jgi:hypothetical protein